jgi:hypothetical protein
MGITAEKMKEVGKCIEQSLVINNNYKSNLKVIERFKGAPYKIGQVLIRWGPGVIAISITAFVIALIRIIYVYPIEPPNPRYVLFNELIKPAGLSFIAGGILCFPVALILGCKEAKKDLENAIKRSGELQKRIEVIIHEKKEIISIIPEKYRYPLAVNFFAEVLENGRADSMKEAMNLYEEQLHRWKMENKMEQILKNQQIDSTALWTYIITDSFFR